MHRLNQQINTIHPKIKYTLETDQNENSKLARPNHN